MTPQEKAKELLAKMTTNASSLIYKNLYAKECALIAIDEIIKECYNWNGSDDIRWEADRFDYWEQVKQELEKL
jgi:hypothetical protein